MSIKKFSQKFARLILKLSNKLKLSYISVLPQHLDVEPINICNFQCTFCKVTYWSKEKRALDIIGFRKILNEFPLLRSIKLQGLGEPLLNKHFLQLLKIAEKNGIQVSFTTNASIYIKELWEYINQSKNVKVFFSIDSANKELFESLRRNSKYEKIIANIKSICSNLSDLNQYSFWTIVNKKNINELYNVVLLAKHLNVKEVHFQLSINNWESDEVRKSNEKLLINKEDVSLKEQIEKAYTFACEQGIGLRIFRNNLYTIKNKCDWPFTRAFIASNGDVVPCCMISDSSVIKMGNVFEKPFKEIWNSSVYRDFRKRIRNNDLYDFCKECYIL